MSFSRKAEPAKEPFFHTGTEDLVIKTSDWVVSTAAARHEFVELNQSMFGGTAIQ